MSFNKNKNGFCHMKFHLNLKSSLLTLDFSVWLSVQYTHTLYLTQKHKNLLQKRINPNCIIINVSFNNFKNGFCHIKSDLNLKSSFLTLHFILSLRSNMQCLNALPVKTAYKYILMKTNSPFWSNIMNL